MARGQSRRPARVAYLNFGSPEPFGGGLRHALAQLGYIEGRNIALEVRSAGGQFDRIEALAAEVVALKPDVIVAGATPTVMALMKATRTIPIVMATAGDAVKTGLVSTLARPGGNVTGLSLALVELAGKMVELVHEALPAAARVACIVNTRDPLHRGFLAEAEGAAKRLSLELRPVLLREPGQVDPAFASLGKARIAAIVVHPIFIVGAPEDRARFVDLTLRHRLAAVSGQRIFADAGGFMAYASNYSDAPKRAALYVDQILKGANPAELPVQQPTKFELVVNNKTAKALGIAVPRNLLLRADEVIE
jgi:putative ABC transport system substrate-binding protein